MHYEWHIWHQVHNLCNQYQISLTTFSIEVNTKFHWNSSNIFRDDTHMKMDRIYILFTVLSILCIERSKSFNKAIIFFTELKLIRAGVAKITEHWCRIQTFSEVWELQGKTDRMALVFRYVPSNLQMFYIWNIYKERIFCL